LEKIAVAGDNANGAFRPSSKSSNYVLGFVIGVPHDLDATEREDFEDCRHLRGQLLLGLFLRAARFGPMRFVLVNESYAPLRTPCFIGGAGDESRVVFSNEVRHHPEKSIRGIDPGSVGCADCVRR
jgi:hypothetical protein